MAGRLVVFVHGWNVRSTDTYGGLPKRLQREAQRAADLSLDVRHIWLGKYINFRDEVRLGDVARAFQNALDDPTPGDDGTPPISQEIKGGKRFICITHSTGGPVVRDWWNRFYVEKAGAGPCPMSHLIMCAPANFGSTLAQLGKARVARLPFWFGGVEPGTGLLDWLELGSPESRELNLKWIRSQGSIQGATPVFPFVLIGQSIDRKLYDHLNSYTDEDGSDGVVRTAAANLNATYVRLEQDPTPPNLGRKRPTTALQMKDPPLRAPRTAFALIRKKAHSGPDMGIIASVTDDETPHPTVDAILRCIRISTAERYTALCDAFDAENRDVRRDERVETVSHTVLPNSTYYHDAHCMIIVSVRDDRNFSVGDYDLTLTAAPANRKATPDRLPTGFFTDRQKNRRDPSTLTYYLSYDVMQGAIGKDPGDTRPVQPPTDKLGMTVEARPNDGFVHYLPAELEATREVLEQFVHADETTVVDIVLKRIVHEGVFRFTTNLDAGENFTNQQPGDPIAQANG